VLLHSRLNVASWCHLADLSHTNILSTNKNFAISETLLYSLPQLVACMDPSAIDASDLLHPGPLGRQTTTTQVTLDRLSAYNSLDLTRRQRCWAPLVRNLRGRAEARDPWQADATALPALTEDVLVIWVMHRESSLSSALMWGRFKHSKRPCGAGVYPHRIPYFNLEERKVAIARLPHHNPVVEAMAAGAMLSTLSSKRFHISRSTRLYHTGAQLSELSTARPMRERAVQGTLLVQPHLMRRPSVPTRHWYTPW